MFIFYRTTILYSCSCCGRSGRSFGVTYCYFSNQIVSTSNSHRLVITYYIWHNVGLSYLKLRRLLQLGKHITEGFHFLGQIKNRGFKRRGRKRKRGRKNSAKPAILSTLEDIYKNFYSRPHLASRSVSVSRLITRTVILTCSMSVPYLLP